MKIAHFDCFSGISGDMTLGALIDAGLSAAKLRRELKKLDIGGYSLVVKKVRKCGMAATGVTVRVPKNAKTGHRHYRDIVRLIEKSALSPKVKKTALSIFRVIGEAEAEAHDTPIEKVHFHEVGAIDSIVDIVCAAIGLDALGIDRVTASAVNTGSGLIKAAHGVMPVPAPATALILRDVPAFADGPAKELTTPTGAAILKAVASDFGPRPAITVSSVGTGAGGYDFEDWPNILRVFIGDAGAVLKDEWLLELVCDIDDMNPQMLPPVSDRLFDAGALDATLTPVYMKKGRPGVALSVLCEPEKRAALEKIIFSDTTTLGVRRREVMRASLPRKIKKVKTEYGTIEVKIARTPDGVVKSAPEFESCRRAAEAKGVSVNAVYRAAIASSKDLRF